MRDGQGHPRQTRAISTHASRRSSFFVQMATIEASRKTTALAQYAATAYGSSWAEMVPTCAASGAMVTALVSKHA